MKEGNGNDGSVVGFADKSRVNVPMGAGNRDMDREPYSRSWGKKGSTKSSSRGGTSQEQGGVMDRSNDSVAGPNSVARKRKSPRK